MKLKLFKSLWGNAENLDIAILNTVQNGYDGLEASIPDHKEDQKLFIDSLNQHNSLLYIAEITTGGGYVPNPIASVQDHLDDFKAKLELSLKAKPIFISTLCGLDAWSLKDKISFVEKLLDFKKEYGIDINIETHRSRITFNPWVTYELIQAIPDLRLTCDFSHWCVVSERLVMNDDMKLLKAIAERCRHVHARIGYDQGPQVPHPAAPEYNKELLAHLSWWKVIWDIRDGKQPLFTMTPEFGPDGYLHQQPFSQEPVGELTEINQWMAERLKQEFDKVAS